MSIRGTVGADQLIANEPHDRLFGLGGDDILISRFERVFMDAGSGNDQLRHKSEFLTSLSDGYDEESFFKSGSGDDRVVSRTIVKTESDFNVDKQIQTESGDDFIFVENNLSAQDTTASATTTIWDRAGDNQITILYELSGTSDTSLLAQARVFLGNGNDVVRYTSTTTADERLPESRHTFLLGEGDNNLKYTELAGNLDFRVESGKGEDRIDIVYNAQSRDERTTNALFSIDTGAGDDVVTMTARSTDGNDQSTLSNIDLGDGNNFLRVDQDLNGQIGILAGDGNDRLDLTTSAGQFEQSLLGTDLEIFVGLGDGDNRVTLDLTVGSERNAGTTDFSLVTGDGSDRVDFNGAIESSTLLSDVRDVFVAKIDTGAGNDQVNVNFADLTLTTGAGRDIVRFSKNAVTNISDGALSEALNPGHNTLVLTDFDFEGGDRFIFTDLGPDGSSITLRSLEDVTALLSSGVAVDLSSVEGDLVLELAENDDGSNGTIVFQGLGFGDALSIDLL